MTVDGRSSPSDFTIGDEVTISATVENNGDGDADGSKLAFYLSGKRIGDAGVNGISSRSEADGSITYTFTNSDVGAHTVRADADSDSAVARDE